MSDGNPSAPGQDSSGQSGSTTMTKADIVERVYDKVGFSKKESSELVEMVFETMKSTLEKGENVKISGFGKFEVRYKHARRGRNPQTGSEIEISARRVLSFKPSQVLKAELAGQPSAGAPAPGAATASSVNPPGNLPTPTGLPTNPAGHAPSAGTPSNGSVSNGSGFGSTSTDRND